MSRDCILIHGSLIRINPYNHTALLEQSMKSIDQNVTLLFEQLTTIDAKVDEF
jgi:hypothetical protein